MTETKQQLRLATATKEDIENLTLLYHILETLARYQATSFKDFEHYPEKDKKLIAQFFNEEGEIDSDTLIEELYELGHGFYRVILGFQTLYENCADKNLDYIDFNEKIKSNFEIVETISNELQKGSDLTIKTESKLALQIIESAKEDTEIQIELKDEK